MTEALYEPDDVDFIVAGPDEETLEFIRRHKARPEYPAELEEAKKKLESIGIDTVTYGIADPEVLLDHWRKTVEELRNER